MEAALAACTDGMSINMAARLYNIPVTTRFWKLKGLIDQPVHKKLGRFRSVFSKDQEKSLAD